MTWEYRVEWFYPGGDPDATKFKEDIEIKPAQFPDMREFLNDLGNDRWELVSTYDFERCEYMPHAIRLVFKRPAPTPIPSGFTDIRHREVR